MSTSQEAPPSSSRTSEAGATININSRIYQTQSTLTLREQCYKSKMCRSFVSSGNCRFAEHCQFAHSESELRLSPASVEAPVLGAGQNGLLSRQRSSSSISDEKRATPMSNSRPASDTKKSTRNTFAGVPLIANNMTMPVPGGTYIQHHAGAHAATSLPPPPPPPLPQSPVTSQSKSIIPPPAPSGAPPPPHCVVAMQPQPQHYPQVVPSAPPYVQQQPQHQPQLPLQPFPPPHYAYAMPAPPPAWAPPCEVPYSQHMQQQPSVAPPLPPPPPPPPSQPQGYPSPPLQQQVISTSTPNYVDSDPQCQASKKMQMLPVPKEASSHQVLPQQQQQEQGGAVAPVPVRPTSRVPYVHNPYPDAGRGAVGSERQLSSSQLSIEAQDSNVE